MTPAGQSDAAAYNNQTTGGGDIVSPVGQALTDELSEGVSVRENSRAVMLYLQSGEQRLSFHPSLEEILQCD